MDNSPAWDAPLARVPATTRAYRRRDLDHVDASMRPPKAFYDRVVATAGALAARHPGQTIALVAHGGVMDCLYRAAVRVTLEAPRSWQLGNAAVNRLLYTAEGFTLVGWSDTAHLEGTAHDEFSDGNRTAAEAGGAHPAGGAAGDRVGHAA